MSNSQTPSVDELARLAIIRRRVETPAPVVQVELEIEEPRHERHEPDTSTSVDFTFEM